MAGFFGRAGGLRGMVESNSCIVCRKKTTGHLRSEMVERRAGVS